MSARNFLSSAVALLALSAVEGRAQRPSFDVATVKRNVTVSNHSGTRTLPGGRIMMENQPLRTVIRSAYGASDLEVIGGPSWIDSDRWDIVASAGGTAATDDDRGEMLKTLLMERFKLVAHVEQRERPIYVLVFARGDRQLGPAIHPTACPPPAGCEGTTGNTNGIVSGTLIGKGRTIADIGRSLSRYAERRVFDRTGLEGKFDYELKWSEDVTVFTAVQEQLGLKFEAQRAPLDVVVVESAERATDDQ